MDTMKALPTLFLEVLAVSKGTRYASAFLLRQTLALLPAVQLTTLNRLYWPVQANGPILNRKHFVDIQVLVVS